MQQCRDQTIVPRHTQSLARPANRAVLIIMTLSRALHTLSRLTNSHVRPHNETSYYTNRVFRHVGPSVIPKKFPGTAKLPSAHDQATAQAGTNQAITHGYL